MNAFLLMIPLFLVRFGLLGFVNREAVKRAAHFAPLKGNENIALIIYQISNIFIVFYVLVLKVQMVMPVSAIGLAVYVVGIGLLVASTICFARPEESGMNTKGIYGFSRIPMYLGYFIYFLGCVLLTGSLTLFVALLVFQISAHWIILSEERWCMEKFGDEYTCYMGKVRRYL